MSDLEEPKEPIANQDSLISPAKQFTHSPVFAFIALALTTVGLFSEQREIPLAPRIILVLLAIILVVFNLLSIPIQKRISKFGFDVISGIVGFLACYLLFFCVSLSLFLINFVARLITGQSVEELCNLGSFLVVMVVAPLLMCACVYITYIMDWRKTKGVQRKDLDK
jgi:hypothetical protein